MQIIMMKNTVMGNRGMGWVPIPLTMSTVVCTQQVLNECLNWIPRRKVKWWGESGALE